MLVCVPFLSECLLRATILISKCQKVTALSICYERRRVKGKGFIPQFSEFHSLAFHPCTASKDMLLSNPWDTAVYLGKMYFICFTGTSPVSWCSSFLKLKCSKSPALHCKYPGSVSLHLLVSLLFLPENQTLMGPLGSPGWLRGLVSIWRRDLS